MLIDRMPENTLKAVEMTEGSRSQIDPTIFSALFKTERACEPAIFIAALGYFARR